MRRVSNRTALAVVIALLLVAGLAVFMVNYGLSGADWATFTSNSHIYSAGVLQNGSVLDRDGDCLLKIQDGVWIYSDDPTMRKATLHCVGDSGSNIATGAVTAFADEITDWNWFDGLYGSSGSVQLTIDDSLCATAYDALAGRNGTVGVYNYKTGEILCLVSSGSWDPNDGVSTANGVYINRLLSATFIPGSVFKTVTAAAALESMDMTGYSFECSGTYYVGDTQVTCSSAHGYQDFTSTLVNSCNCAFADIALKMGSRTLYSFAAKAGFTESMDVSGITTAPGSLDILTVDDETLAWSGVGQGVDMVNPCTLMYYMGAVANGGTAAQPVLLCSADLPGTAAKGRTVMDSHTAQSLSLMMSRCVTENYGAANFPGLNLCAKSGTAEVGEGLTPHAWFCGFLQDSEHPYAFVVLVENGGGGAAVAGPIANTVLQKAVFG